MPPDEVLNEVAGYLKQFLSRSRVQLKSDMLVRAHTLFMTNIEVFQCEIENEKISQEIRLDALKFEEVNKKQLDITIRNTYISLAVSVVLPKQ
ncbi:hypothetical protein BGX26_007395 [Mortierella sp. AD094]|nr:hypothetical protein BGX26_007395 [Mortierella sp. AD094]